MNKKTLVALIVGAIMFTLVLMKFGSHGSFDPGDVGFYTAIGAGLLWFFGMYFIFKKLINRGKAKDQDSQD